MVNLSNHHKISRSGKLHSVIDNGLKSCIFIKVDDLLTSGRTHQQDKPYFPHPRVVKILRLYQITVGS
jgi:hypothetical protein